MKLEIEAKLEYHGRSIAMDKTLYFDDKKIDKETWKELRRDLQSRADRLTGRKFKKMEK